MSQNVSRQQFAAFIQTLPYWSDIWTTEQLNNWATVPQESKNLENLYQSYILGNPSPILNYVYAESGHNLEQPSWVSYKSDVYTPDIAFLTNLLADMAGRVAEYEAVGGADATLVSSINAEILTIRKTLSEYQADLAAEK